jgi:peroxiredoxin
LGQLREIEPELIELGYQIIAISPDRPEKIRELLSKTNYDYTLLSDSDMTAAKAFGLAFQVSDETVDRYHQYDIDLVDAAGRKHRQLPVPAVFIVDPEGKIEFSYVNPVYQERVHPSVVLAAARAAI